MLKGIVMQRHKLILLLFLLSIFEAQSVETYKVALLESYPWAYRTDSNVIKGIYPKLFHEIENKHDASIKFDIQLMPLARVIREIEKSKIDITIMSHHANRKIKMVYQLPLYKTPFVLFTRLNSGIEKLADIKYKNVAMLIGGSGCPCLSEDIPYQKIKVSKHLQGLGMLMKDRVDAVSGPYIRLNERIKELAIQEKVAKPIIYEWRTVSLWTSHALKKNNKNLTLLTNEINKKLTEGLLEKLLSDYFSTTELTYIITPESLPSSK